MKARPLVLILVLAVAIRVEAAPVAVEQLAPVTPWQAEYAEGSCRLSRSFGSADNPFLIQFERFGMSDGFQLMLAGNQLKGWRPPNRLSIRYGSGGRPDVQEHYTVGTTAAGMPVIMLGSSLAPVLPGDKNVTPVTPEMEAAITAIDIAYQDRRITLNTASLGAPFGHLRKCADQLLAGWGVDPEKVRHASRRATPASNPASWATSADYRDFAGSNGDRATVNFRLVVGVDGRVSRCSVQMSYPNNRFDDLTCKLILQRARFRPGLDAAGQPMPDVYFNRVRWMPPGG